MSAAAAASGSPLANCDPRLTHVSSVFCATLLTRCPPADAAQLGGGVIAGIALAIVMDMATEGEALGSAGLTMLPIIAATTIVVGLLAAFGPARRGLRVQPIEALRDQ